MRLRYTPQGLAEIDDILAFLARRSPRAATQVAKRLNVLASQVAKRPAIGQRTTEDRLRRIVATPYPYILFYEMKADEVVIVGVRHGARDPRSMPFA